MQTVQSEVRLRIGGRMATVTVAMPPPQADLLQKQRKTMSIFVERHEEESYQRVRGDASAFPVEVTEHGHRGIPTGSFAVSVHVPIVGDVVVPVTLTVLTGSQYQTTGRSGTTFGLQAHL